VIIVAISDCRVVRVIAVVVVAAVVPVVRVQCCNTQRSQKFLLHNLQSFPSIFRVEQLRGNCHSDGEVAAQLVVTPGVSTAHGVLIDVSLVNQVFPLLVRVVHEDPEMFFEVGLDLGCPVTETPLEFRLCSFD
jgi:hypothetical protein